MNDVGAGGNIKFETYMKSALILSPSAGTATLPLHKGYVGDGTSSAVYYVITDASDCETAKSLGINYAPKLGFLIDGSGNPLNKSVQKVTVDAAGAFHFAGGVDFSPVRIFTPSIAPTPTPLTQSLMAPKDFRLPHLRPAQSETRTTRRSSPTPTRLENILSSTQLKWPTRLE